MIPNTAWDGIRRGARELLPLPVELLLLLDAAGQEVARLQGDEHAVETNVHPRAFYTGRVLLHNHPGMQVGPSLPDIVFTAQTAPLGHIIVTRELFYVIEPQGNQEHWGERLHALQHVEAPPAFVAALLPQFYPAGGWSARDYAEDPQYRLTRYLCDVLGWRFTVEPHRLAVPSERIALGAPREGAD